MKIGKFSKKHNITQDTIRHYIDMGLLVVEKQGCQYKFSEEDSHDIEKIFKLKQLDFSLTEIQEILCFNRLEGDKSDAYRNLYLSLLERKQDQIIKEQQKCNEINLLLKDRIKELKMDGISTKRNLGFPLAAIGLLQCPDCDKTLDISGGTVEKNMMLEATIRCECGYTAIIDNGIYIDEKVARKKLMPTKREFFEAASPNYINFLYNGTTTLIDYIQTHGNNPKYIMELDNCTGRFLMHYIDYLPKNCTYILICHDKERIANMKKNLELQYEHNHFIFFCCELDKLPISKSSIDIIIDHWMSKTYAKTSNKVLLDVVAPYLKQEGLLTGAFPHIGAKCKDFINIPLELRGYFNKNIIFEKLESLDLSQLEAIDLGPIIEDNPYIDIRNKELFQTIYVGKKKINFEVITSIHEQHEHEIQHKHNRIS
ncbi:MerR family transcriptional regulator [Paenibacillus segetis]|uniref:Methyltransferase n=1 Tax=Paenibacillus segetis TaxID=1325360 RepID=A0ABQ1YS11_9BACL|nr:MerR family transcriptional regulator [Paenibacillus segetis]GGH34846.1 methyltransferase [Paenibacillus segetis]